MRIVRETRRPIVEIPASSGARGSWATGSARIASSGARRVSAPMTEPSSCGCASAAPSWRWSVMCSNDQWSSGSRRQRGERLGAHRGPEDRTRRAPCCVLSGAGRRGVDVLQVAAPPADARAAAPRRGGRPVRERFDASGGTYGSPRVRAQLRPALRCQVLQGLCARAKARPDPNRQSGRCGAGTCCRKRLHRRTGPNDSIHSSPVVLQFQRLLAIARPQGRVPRRAAPSTPAPSRSSPPSNSSPAAATGPETRQDIAAWIDQRLHSTTT